jgi:hypothetical protein
MCPSMESAYLVTGVRGIGVEQANRSSLTAVMEDDVAGFVVPDEPPPTSPDVLTELPRVIRQHPVGEHLRWSARTKAASRRYQGGIQGISRRYQGLTTPRRRCSASDLRDGSEAHTHIRVERIRRVLLAEPLLLSLPCELLFDCLTHPHRVFEVHQPAVDGAAVPNGHPGGESRGRAVSQEDVVVVHARGRAGAGGEVGPDQLATEDEGGGPFGVHAPDHVEEVCRGVSGGVSFEMASRPAATVQVLYSYSIGRSRVCAHTEPRAGRHSR